jgi:hypothetical protein
MLNYEITCFQLGKIMHSCHLSFFSKLHASFGLVCHNIFGYFLGMYLFSRISFDLCIGTFDLDYFLSGGKLYSNPDYMWLHFYWFGSNMVIFCCSSHVLFGLVH